MKQDRHTSVHLPLAAAAMGLMISPAIGADVTFKGKTINVIVGSSPGGGTDGTTRLVGQYLEKYLPGKPRLVYRNMPAGHGVKANNYFVARGKRDGTTWIGGSSSYVNANALRKKVVEYDPTKYQFFGGIFRGGSVVIMRKSKQENLLDKSKPPVIGGVLDGTRTWAELMVWGSELLGWNFQYVVGYPGSAALALAARRGEIDAFGTSVIAMHRNMSANGEFVGLAQIGQFSGGKYSRRTSFQDVPIITELVEGKTSGIARRAFDYWTKANQVDKWYALPPDTKPEIVKVYGEAFAKAAKDPEFIKFGEHQFSADFTPQTGQDVYEAVAATAYPSSDILDYLRSIRVKHGLPAAQLSDEEMARLAKKLTKDAVMPTVLVKLDEVKSDGRELLFKVHNHTHSAKVSSSRTKIKIDAKDAKRADVKSGMDCLVAYPGDGQQASSIDCATKPDTLAALHKRNVDLNGVSTKLADVQNGGRVIVFKAGDATHKAKVSSSRTKISIGGLAVQRGDLKSGLSCTVKYAGDGLDAEVIDCN
ncbi:MAG: hypothetical protein RLZ98_3397 [Pseudomonadota bacterium]|jgi:tripartite-type tricarboxylate transporter receptor subunit TctC